CSTSWAPTSSASDRTPGTCAGPGSIRLPSSPATPTGS
ncbi:MAG: Inosose dehydratase, partial [uncultured Friedmanniella sp.]